MPTSLEPGDAHPDLSQRGAALHIEDRAMVFTSQCVVETPHPVTAGASGGNVAGLELVPDALLKLVLHHSTKASVREFRCASLHCKKAATLLACARDAHLLSSEAWGSSVNASSRRLLRAGRSCACWLFLELVVFPCLLMIHTLQADVPIWIVFLPCWAALTMSLRTAWTSIHLRRALADAIALRDRARRYPLLQVDRQSVQECRAFNILHIAVSFPLPLVHVALLAQWYVGGCLLSLMPSLAISVLSVWALLRRRCKVQAVCGMLSSIAVVVEWGFFPACLLPATGPLGNLPAYKVVFWLMPVTIPYFLIFCFAVEARSCYIALATLLTYISVLSLHLALLGVVGNTIQATRCAAFSCAAMGAAGSVLSRWVWQRASPPRGVCRRERLESAFALVTSILE